MAKLIALSRAAFDVTLDSQEGDADAVVFQCDPLTASQRAKIQDMITASTSGDGIGVAVGSRFLYAMRYGLREIVPPMEDANGKVITPRRVGGALPPEFLDQIPDEVMIEVGRKIIDQSALTPEQTGE